MGDNEKEIERLRKLLEDVPTDEEIEDAFSDAESDFCQESDHDSGTNMSASEDSSNDDQRMDTSSGASSPTLPLSHFIGKDNRTKWRREPGNTQVRTRRQNIITHLPGSRHLARNAKTPLECFSLFIDKIIIDIIVSCTNIKIEKESEKTPNDRTMYLTNEAEVRAVIGLLILAGSVRSGHQNLNDLWNSKRMGIDIFHTTMNFKRFWFLLKCLRFDDINSREDRLKTDKLSAIRCILDIFTRNCQKHYCVSEYCTIDEQLVSFRGRCSFRQYMPNKPAKYGLKIFTMTDARTWYTLSMEVYVGIQPEGPYKLSNSASEIVLRLVQPIRNSGRNVTADNWFSSIPLVRSLLDIRLTYVGTIRKNKKELPKEFVITKTRDVKSTVFGFQENMTILSYVPKKNKNVVLISSMHLEDNSIDQKSGTDQKPEIITFYNLTKGGVDVVDELCGTYSTSRKTNRWPLVLFFRILDLAGINSQVIYAANNQSSNIIRLQYLQDLGFSLLTDQLKNRAENVRLPRELRKKAAKACGMGDKEPDTQPHPTTSKSRCTICPRKKDIKTKQYCNKCNQTMCLKHMKNVCEKCFDNLEEEETDSEY